MLIQKNIIKIKPAEIFWDLLKKSVFIYILGKIIKKKMNITPNADLGLRNADFGFKSKEFARRACPRVFLSGDAEVAEKSNTGSYSIIGKRKIKKL